MTNWQQTPEKEHKTFDTKLTLIGNKRNKIKKGYPTKEQKERVDWKWADNMNRATKGRRAQRAFNKNLVGVTK